MNGVIRQSSPLRGYAHPAPGSSGIADGKPAGRAGPTSVSSQTGGRALGRVAAAWWEHRWERD